MPLCDLPMGTSSDTRRYPMVAEAFSSARARSSLDFLSQLRLPQIQHSSGLVSRIFGRHAVATGLQPTLTLLSGRLQPSHIP